MSDITSDETLTGARRNLKVGTTAGTVLWNGLRSSFGFTGDRTRQAQALKEALGTLRGPLVKFAQLLASIPELLPPEYQRELTELQSNAPAMGRPFVKRRMANELGRDWRRRFAEFDLEPAAAASLGQVHRARLHGGREVACKLQYPSMAETVSSDLRQAGWLMALFERYEGSIRTGRIVDELKARILEELDYTLEHRRMAMYREILAEEPQVHVPQPVPELSTGRLLTAEWLHGRPIAEAFDTARYDQKTRNRIALNVFQLWYRPLYDYAVIHGDPHFGNYTIRDDSSVNLMDFGCVRVFPATFVEGVIKLYEALRDEDMEKAAYAYRCWGFAELTHDLMETLNAWARFVYAPLLDDSTRPMGASGHVAEGRTRLTEVRRKLAEAGGVELPSEFVFMDRASVGLGALALRLDARINWHRLFNEMSQGFDLETVQARQDALLARHGHPAADAAQRRLV
jgi:predicted unusual protein kinase regulating ubiquinone biosynthesis (AarF/ABC1/UbiB family)